MNPISPRAQHILRFSGVDNHNQVLKALEASRLQQESADLFGRDAGVDMFVKQNPHDNHATVEIAANKLNALHFAGGFFRNFYRQAMGIDPKPVLVNEHPGDLFEHSFGSNN